MIDAAIAATTRTGAAAHTESRTTISVVICAHDTARWPLLQQAVESVRAQGVEHELTLVVDHCPALVALATERWADLTVIDHEDGESGLSGARNAGIARSTGDVVVFLDDDAAAAPGWLAAITAPFTDPHVLGTGGMVLPVWPQARPAWFPEQFDWVVGCSYDGLPTERAPIRNPIGASMAIRRSVLLELDGFVGGIGRRGQDAAGCEETELCIRATQRHPHARFEYVPDAVVHHTVDPSRTTWAYFSRRCRAEGMSKARVADRVGRTEALAAERRYVRSVLPRAAGRNLLRALRGEPGALGRCGAIVAGLAGAGVGYVREKVAA